MKKNHLILLLLFIGGSCNKNPDDPIEEKHETVTIGSPYLEEVLIDLGIDSDGTINQQVLKSEIEALEELVIQINLAKGGEPCVPKYDYDVGNKNLLASLEGLSNLRKATLTIRPNLNEDKTNFSQISSADCSMTSSTDVVVNFKEWSKLEEFYFANRLGRPYKQMDLNISNCPLLKKIGTANVTKGIKDYPSESTIQMDVKKVVH